MYSGEVYDVKFKRETPQEFFTLNLDTQLDTTPKDEMYL